MRARLTAVALAALVTLGCEQGWQLEGEVVTEGIARRERSLLVLLFMDPVLGPDGLPQREEHRIGHLLAQAAMIPPDKQPLSFTEIGCVEDTFQLVAWAPSRPRTFEPNRTSFPARAFDPEPGDLLAFTAQTPITDCGYSGTQRISLRLTDRPYAP